jgi:ATP-dependent exoDNAse (exonuclease V) alpha subunit
VFRVPRSYLARNAELGYGGNVHVAEGRTVDTAHLLVTDSLSRQALYVGMTRGRESNTAHVVTGKTVPLACRRGAEATSSAECGLGTLNVWAALQPDPVSAGQLQT